jgi:hypothetical protein
MKKHPADPKRLIDLPPTQDPAQVSLLIRSAIAAASEDTPRVKWRIRSTLRDRTERRSRVLRVVLVGTCIFVVGGVVGAAVQPFLRKTNSAAAPPGSLPALPTASPSARTHAHLQAPPAVPAPVELSVSKVGLDALAEVALVEPAEASAPQPSKAIGRRATVARPHVPTRAEAVPAAPTPSMPTTPLIAPPQVISPDEQALIATALNKLRTSRNPQAALVAVDEYRARFPTGVLAPEAARLRTEALLMLGRKSVVLDELERSSSTDALTGDERLLLRGELRAAVGRWQAALADFQAVANAHPSCASESHSDNQRTQERLERALWGRATARSHVDNEAGAVSDLREYLRCFPDGRFSAQATRLLEGRR